MFDAGTATAALQVLGKINSSLQAIVASSIGTFTMDADASTTVTDAAVSTDSFVALTPRNAAAGTLQAGATHVYVTPGDGSFTVATANGGAAGGTESFSYAVFVSRL